MIRPIICIWKDLGPMHFWSHSQSFSHKNYKTKVSAHLLNSQLVQAWHPLLQADELKYAPSKLVNFSLTGQMQGNTTFCVLCHLLPSSTSLLHYSPSCQPPHIPSLTKTCILNPNEWIPTTQLWASKAKLISEEVKLRISYFNLTYLRAHFTCCFSYS